MEADENNNATISDMYAFTINKSTPVVTINGSAVFTYSGKPQAPENATVVGSTGIITFTYEGAGSTSYPISAIRPKNVGDYKVVASISADNNYAASSSEPFEFSIIKAPLTVTATSVSKTVNFPNPIFSLEYNGFVTGEDESSLSTLPTASTDATTSSPVGDYDIIVSGGAANNYEFVTYVNGILTIDTKLTPEITFNNISKIYGDASFVLNPVSNSQGAFSYRSTNIISSIFCCNKSITIIYYSCWWRCTDSTIGFYGNIIASN